LTDAFIPHIFQGLAKILMLILKWLKEEHGLISAEWRLQFSQCICNGTQIKKFQTVIHECLFAFYSDICTCKRLLSENNFYLGICTFFSIYNLSLPLP